MRKGMKTEASADVVGFGDALHKAFRTHQRRQREARIKSKVWNDAADLVFTTAIGTALEPRGVNRAWSQVCQRAGVPDARIHDLRHAFGTELAGAGFHPKVIQKALRHSRMATTEIYVHAAREVNREVPAAMDRHVSSLRKAASRSSRRSS